MTAQPVLLPFSWRSVPRTTQQPFPGPAVARGPLLRQRKALTGRFSPLPTISLLAAPSPHGGPPASASSAVLGGSAGGTAFSSARSRVEGRQLGAQTRRRRMSLSVFRALLLGRTRPCAGPFCWRGTRGAYVEESAFLAT